jgi:solute carrier family 31 (copper transporter), member 1
MLFTWDTTNLCIIFQSWRITGIGTLILSLLAVIALTAGYEAVREASRRYELRLQREVEEMPSKLILVHTGRKVLGLYF